TSAPTPSRSPQAPRTWGWTGPGVMVSMIEVAGPTHVGMDRQIHRSINTPRSRPHARGDGPIAYRKRKKEAKQAPRTWGWTVGGHRVVHRSCAGPTHVGMDRGLRGTGGSGKRRPHARGDGP